MYGVHVGTGAVVSRKGSMIAVPDGALAARMQLVEVDVYAFKKYRDVKWTKRIPLEIKNVHREFWKMPRLKCRACGWEPMIHGRLGNEAICGRCMGLNPVLLKAKLIARKARMHGLALKDKHLGRLEEMADQGVLQEDEDPKPGNPPLPV